MAQIVANELADLFEELGELFKKKAEVLRSADLEVSLFLW